MSRGSVALLHSSEAAMIWQGGQGLWRACLYRNNKCSPWFMNRISAECWVSIAEDRLRPLVDAGFDITGVIGP